MKQQIENYSPKSPSIVAIGDRRIRAFVADAQPRLGSVLWVGNTPTRIVTLAGGHRVEAIAFDVSGFAVGDAVHCSDEEAAWPSPRSGVTVLDDLAFEPDGAAVPAGPILPSEALRTGIGVLDGLLPLAKHGVTLIMDAGAPDRCTDRVIEAWRGPLACASARAVPAATHQILGESGLALMIATQWGRSLGGALLLEAAPFDIDELLATTQSLTSIVRIHLHDGLEILAETLELGHSDTQIMLTDEGLIDLTRSASRLCPDPDLAEELGGLEAAREHQRIFGEHELNDAHRVLLERASYLEDDLLDET